MHKQETTSFTPSFYGPQRPLYSLIVTNARDHLSKFCEAKEGVTVKQFRDNMAMSMRIVLRAELSGPWGRGLSREVWSGTTAGDGDGSKRVRSVPRRGGC